MMKMMTTLRIELQKLQCSSIRYFFKKTLYCVNSNHRWYI